VCIIFSTISSRVRVISSFVVLLARVHENTFTIFDMHVQISCLCQQRYCIMMPIGYRSERVVNFKWTPLLHWCSSAATLFVENGSDSVCLHVYSI